jgi:hypothetical protein
MDSSSIASTDKKETTTKEEQIQLHKANKHKTLKQNLLFFANLQVLHQHQILTQNLLFAKLQVSYFVTYLPL